MPLFESFSEIIASLTPRRPRRGQPDDRQRSDVQHRRSPTQHETSLNPRRRSRSPLSRASRRINTAQAEFSLGSEPDNDRLSEPRSTPTTRHTAAHLQVRDTQELYTVSLHLFLLFFLPRLPYITPGFGPWCHVFAGTPGSAIYHQRIAPDDETNFSAQTTQSYDNGPLFDPRPATTRGQLRPPLSQCVIDPTAR